MHGNTLAAALRKAGADVILAPVYTPLRTDEENVSIDRLAMGGINVYLDESLPLWRWMPSLVRRQLDRPSLVSWAARLGSSTRPQQLGRLTMAMLRGEDGPLKSEVQQLIDWLQAEVQPDIVHLSNVMLAGLVRQIRQRLGVPVIATLSGEDSFLEKLPSSYYFQARAELRMRAADLSGLVAMSEYYADFMAEYLAVPREKIDVIRPGLNLDGYGGESGRWAVGGGQKEGNSLDFLGRAESGRVSPNKRPKTIGFLSRVCADKGLHLLIESLHAMRETGSLPPYRLRVAGYLDRSDRAYLDEIQKRLATWGMTDCYEYFGELDRSGKIAFLQSLDVLCLPSLIRESKGLPVLEAWACGVPAVLPDRGAFTEMIADTGGGLLYDPQHPEALSVALGRMLRDDSLAAKCGKLAQHAVHSRYTSLRESYEMLALYERLSKIKTTSLEPFSF